jgi:hypothetical protein
MAMNTTEENVSFVVEECIETHANALFERVEEFVRQHTPFVIQEQTESCIYACIRTIRVPLREHMRKALDTPSF